MPSTNQQRMQTTSHKVLLTLILSLVTVAPGTGRHIMSWAKNNVVVGTLGL